jgi:hypothetical protein
MIVLPWHNPVLLAEQAATVDLLSGGRLDLGIGKGYRYKEFDGFAVSMEEAEARFEESLEVLLKAWTSEKGFSHHGKDWWSNDIVAESSPGAEAASAGLDGRWQRTFDPRRCRTRLHLLLEQFASPNDVVHSIAVFKATVEASGRRYDPMRVNVNPCVLRR